MEKPIGPLTVISPVKYSFVIPEGKIPEVFYIKFGTFCRVNNCPISVKLEIEGGHISSWSLNAHDLKDNAYHPFPITKKWLISKPSSATITIHCHAKYTNNAIAVFYDDEGVGNIVVGTKRIPGVLIFDFDFSEDIKILNKIKEESETVLNDKGSDQIRLRRIEGIEGLVSVVCGNNDLKESWSKLLSKESYNCFEFVSCVSKSRGEYILQKMNEELPICKDIKNNDYRNIENAIHMLRESNGASYVCIEEYPSAVFSKSKYIKNGDLYKDGRWGANGNYIPNIKRNTNSKLAVYTAVMEEYDGLFDDFEPEENVDYICFTNGRMKGIKNWDVRGVPLIDGDSTRTARMYKILAHRFLPEYKRCVWMDGNFEICGSIKELSKQNPGSLVMMKHDLRDCIYDELQACIDLRKDNKDIMQNQVGQYRLEKYPEHNGLVMTGCMIRSHNEQHIQKIMEDWWKEVKTKSCRDQLSFNYVAWKNKTEMELISHKVVLSEYFRKAEHKRKNKLWQKK